MPLETQLQTHFGFHTFKPGQKETITKVLAGHSAAAIFATGSGKSLCYQLPALLLPGLTLVVSPLLALMKDQLDFLLKQGIAAARLDSTLSVDEYRQVLQQAKNKQLKILMISVERFKNERFRHQLSQMQVSLLVIDEAHCISEWGHNFRPDYLKLPHYQQAFNIPQVLLLTATATTQVIEHMCDKFAMSRDNVVITGFYRKNLFLQMSPVDSQYRNAQLLARMQTDKTAATIVYVTLQKTAQMVANYLHDNGIDAQFYHAGMSSEQREQLQNQFMQGQVACIVATIAFGMGIDKADVRRVIHYDLPKSIESYSQEIGRCGRDGQMALCEVMANDDSLNTLQNFVYGDTPEKLSIQGFLGQIHSSEEDFLELKLTTLSKQLNMRVLPLKTLLVYLEMEAIITPQYTYYADYSFKNIASNDTIIQRFMGERRDFIQTIFTHCISKQKYTYVDMQAILSHDNASRERVIKALDYLHELGLIELQAKLAVERYKILTKNFDLLALTDKMDYLFVQKEQMEIKRIGELLDFFAADSCLSKQLAQYFSDNLAFESCGHCSHCQSGQVNFHSSMQLKAITDWDFFTLSEEFKLTLQKEYSVNNLCKFLCGINTPIFARHKIKSMSHFARLEAYPFAQVKQWILANDC